MPVEHAATRNVVHAVQARGPDALSSRAFPGIGLCPAVTLTASVLGMRELGAPDEAAVDHVIQQPIDLATGGAMAWVGELWGMPGVDMDMDAPDTPCLVSLVETAVAGEGEISEVAARLAAALVHLQGPVALVVWDAKRSALFMARDPLARRSLLIGMLGSHLQIASTLPAPGAVELPCTGVWALQCSTGIPTGLAAGAVQHLQWAAEQYAEPSPLTEEAPAKPAQLMCAPWPTAGAWGLARLRTPRARWSVAGADGPCSVRARAAALQVAQPIAQAYLAQLLASAVVKRAHGTPRYCPRVLHTQLLARRDLPCPAGLTWEQMATVPCLAPGPARHAHAAAHVGVLFSGGVDSAVLAALLHQALPADEPIDLISVCFKTPRPNEPVAAEEVVAAPCLLAELLTASGSPDRKAAWRAYHDLRVAYPARRWRLVCVNEDQAALASACSHVAGLMYPASTVMDFSIAAAAWFAARGVGWVCEHEVQVDVHTEPEWSGYASSPLHSSQQVVDAIQSATPWRMQVPDAGAPLAPWLSQDWHRVPAVARSSTSASAEAPPCSPIQRRDAAGRVWTLVNSTARALVLGMGADEQLGGYTRYRTAFARGTSLPQGDAWAELDREMQRDCDRIWLRNLGRDDRVVSDHGREARFPFLDDALAAGVRALPLALLTNPQHPDRGIGDKCLLRGVAASLGLHAPAKAAKQAIQFGSRAAKVINASAAVDREPSKVKGPDAFAGFGAGASTELQGTPLAEYMSPSPRAQAENRCFEQFNEEHWRVRAGVVAWRAARGDEPVMVLQPSSSKHDRWILPAGTAYTGEPTEHVAIREAYEEAGVVGTLGDVVVVLPDPVRRTSTTFYSMEVTHVHPNPEGRAVRWAPVQDAYDSLASSRPVPAAALKAWAAAHDIEITENT